MGVLLSLIFLDFLKELKIKELLLKSLLFTIIPFLVYLSVFAIHFSLLNQSGPGDAFMSQSFQKTLEGSNVSQDVKTMPFLGKFLELNIVMYTSSANLKATHPDGSTWYEWPLMKKPIWYWTNSEGSLKGNIYLIGNPLIWLFVLIGIPVVILNLSDKKFSRKDIFWIYILLLGFFANILPYIFIKRITFLYHYLPSLVFGILILALFIDKDFKELPKKIDKPYRVKKLLAKGKEIENKLFFGFPSKNSFFLYFSYLAIVFLFFMFLSPITYGIFLPDNTSKIYGAIIKFFH